jgi:hypothetical protein
MLCVCRCATSVRRSGWSPALPHLRTASLCDTRRACVSALPSACPDSTRRSCRAPLIGSGAPRDLMMHCKMDGSMPVRSPRTSSLLSAPRRDVLRKRPTHSALPTHPYAGCGRGTVHDSAYDAHYRHRRLRTPLAGASLPLHLCHTRGVRLEALCQVRAGPPASTRDSHSSSMPQTLAPKALLGRGEPPPRRCSSGSSGRGACLTTPTRVHSSSVRAMAAAGVFRLCPPLACSPYAPSAMASGHTDKLV